MGSYLSYHYINKPKRMSDCIDCVYFHAQSTKNTCRKEPPHPEHWFPEVFHGDWCGQFKAEPSNHTYIYTESTETTKLDIVYPALIFGVLVLIAVYVTWSALL